MRKEQKNEGSSFPFSNTRVHSCKGKDFFENAQFCENVFYPLVCMDGFTNLLTYLCLPYQSIVSAE